MSYHQIIYTILFAAAMLFFCYSCIKRFGLLALGKKENRFRNLSLRLWYTFFYVFGQKRVLEKPYGSNHFIIFWSFMLLLLANGEFLVKGLIPVLSLDSLPVAIQSPLFMLFDIVSLFALVSVFIAAVRRFIKPPFPGALTFEAFIILGMIGTLMTAYFSMHGAYIAAGREIVAASMPVSSIFASLFYQNMTPTALEPYIAFWWWVHALVLLVFLNYLPYSKHMHILTSIPNIFFRRKEKPNAMPREVFEKNAVYGAGDVSGFSWKDLLDAYSCTECGRCQMVCPAGITGKPLNPRLVIHDMKVNLLKNGPLMQKGKSPVMPLIGDAGEGSISEDSIWSCTTCGACMEVCPVFIEQMPKLIHMRRHLVEMKASFPPELLNLFENIEQRSNPWGVAPGDRTKWYSMLQVKPFDKDTEYLFYVGCAGALDTGSKQVSVAMAMILDAAGVSWGVLGKDELCCGDSLRRLGNEFAFETLAKNNVKLLKDKGVKKIITTCPHCFSTLFNDYKDFGLEAEVIHHTVLLDELLKSGALKLSKPLDLGKTVYHDACYLGRHNGIYKEPRDVIHQVTGKSPVEMTRNHSRSFCCGAGGGRMWMEESLGSRINIERVEEALEKQPDTICAACPYCTTMLIDGLKDKKSEHVQVKNIAEIVAEALFLKK